MLESVIEAEDIESPPTLTPAMALLWSAPDAPAG